MIEHLTADDIFLEILRGCIFVGKNSLSIQFFIIILDFSSLQSLEISLND